MFFRKIKKEITILKNNNEFTLNQVNKLRSENYFLLENLKKINEKITFNYMLFRFEEEKNHADEIYIVKDYDADPTIVKYWSKQNEKQIFDAKNIQGKPGAKVLCSENIYILISVYS